LAGSVELAIVRLESVARVHLVVVIVIVVIVVAVGKLVVRLKTDSVVVIERRHSIPDVVLPVVVVVVVVVVLELVGTERAALTLLEESVQELLILAVNNIVLELVGVLERLRITGGVNGRIAGSEGVALAILEGAILDGVLLEVPIVV